ncbi:MAG: alginate lyase family protein [Phycisphaeraceae bacterium]
MSLASAGRLLRTVRHLRASQLGWRVRYAVRRRREQRDGPGLRRVLDRLAGNSRASDAPLPSVHWPIPGDARARLEELERGELTLAGATLPFPGDGDDPWRLRDAGRSHRLWTHQLHYHHWLLDLAGGHVAQPTGACGRVLAGHLADWLDRCPAGAPGFNVFAWNSYAIATRIGAWGQVLRLLPADYWQTHAGLRDRLIQSLAQQTAYLETHLEWDLRANHLLRDIVGLAWAGRLLQGPAVHRWRGVAHRLAREQLIEQVAPDGGHYERSPMYHVHAMQDVHSLALLVTDLDVRDRLVDAWRRMADWLAWMRHPDGTYPLLNDANEAGADAPADVLAGGADVGVDVPEPPGATDKRSPLSLSVAAAERTDKAADGFVSGTPSSPSGGRHFRDTGYIVWHGPMWSVFFDAASVGPDHQPGHAHADTLTLEASWRGQRLFIDPGTGSYDHDDVRRYDRSTGAHNTVTIDDEDSSEVWHIFRVGRRARPRDVRADFTADTAALRAGHDGYDHLRGRPAHERAITVQEPDHLTIHDQVTGSRDHRVAAGLLLHPEWHAVPRDGGWTLERGEARLVVELEADRPIAHEIQQRAWHPRFGCEIITPRLAWSYTGPLPLSVKVHVRQEAS